MSKKLLNKTTSKFLTFSVIILVCSAPLFYFVSHWLYTYETDELLLFHKQDFLEQHQSFTEADLAFWNKYNKNASILPEMGMKKDSIVSKIFYDKIAKEDIPYRIIYAPIEINGKKYTYNEKINLVEMEGMVLSIALMFLLVITVFLVGIVWISKRSSKKIWEPFYDTLYQIHHFEIDKNKPPKFAVTEIKEFDSLNKSIERLIEKNTAIYKAQKEFIENAAHELQTPLALFQSKIDTIIQTTGLSKEQSLLLNALNNDVSRLNRLNKNLLLLSKIENDSYFEKQYYSVNDYIIKNLDFFEEQAEAKNIQISSDLGESLKIETNPVLIEVLVNNLFLNAIRHNVKDGQINIEINNKQLIFKNSGQENALPIEKLFNRFSKSNPSAKGNGLGLAIVKKITELNNWTIEYSFENNLHKFLIKF
ncbi:HAMP domain-containing sensor histidine kinase [uncultured Flavobacterium sp.]|uniref:sensor histidine kinase n=1 Tax=uncultured Flavobacterium sp. TaxID=165435 RepID=UPI0025D0F330|nr:HAMP domain-containing sensor histidine kinase [uncultured Flavobacterium sp.]